MSTHVALRLTLLGMKPAPHWPGDLVTHCEHVYVCAQHLLKQSEPSDLHLLLAPTKAYPATPHVPFWVPL